MDRPPANAGQATAVRQASTDTQLVALWLHERSRHTQRAYRADVERFVEFAGRPLHAVTLADVQDFADSLLNLAPASQARTLSAVKVPLGLWPPHRIPAVRCW